MTAPGAPGGAPLLRHLGPRGDGARAEVAPAPVDCGAPPETRAPDPRCGEALDGRAPPGPDSSAFARGALAVPRVATQVLLWPIVETSDVVEHHHLLDWMATLLTTDDGLVGVRPYLHYSTGFLASIGARLFWRRLPGHHELAAHLETGGPHIIVTRLHFRPLKPATPGPGEPPLFRALEPLGFIFDLTWNLRDDRLFAGHRPEQQAGSHRRGGRARALRLERDRRRAALVPPAAAAARRAAPRRRPVPRLPVDERPRRPVGLDAVRPPARAVRRPRAHLPLRRPARAARLQHRHAPASRRRHPPPRPARAGTRGRRRHVPRRRHLRPGRRERSRPARDVLGRERARARRHRSACRRARARRSGGGSARADASSRSSSRRRARPGCAASPRAASAA